MDRTQPPVHRPDQIRPFTPEQIDALLIAARRGPHPARDEALLLLMLDTGARVSEVAGLRFKDLDLKGRRCQVLGKGNKARSVFFGPSTAKALVRYLNEDLREPDEPLFLADGGTRAGEGLTDTGIRLLVRRLGKAAKLQAVRCSPHTPRHTFAISFLRGGGNVFTLQQLLGHTNLVMSMRYCAIAQADLEQQHRAYSPVEQIRNRRSR